MVPAQLRTRKQGAAALQVMEDHLATRAFFVGPTPTIADIASREILLIVLETIEQRGWFPRNQAIVLLTSIKHKAT